MCVFNLDNCFERKHVMESTWDSVDWKGKPSVIIFNITKCSLNQNKDPVSARFQSIILICIRQYLFSFHLLISQNINTWQDKNRCVKYQVIKYSGKLTAVRPTFINNTTRNVKQTKGRWSKTWLMKSLISFDLGQREPVILTQVIWLILQ